MSGFKVFTGLFLLSFLASCSFSPLPKATTPISINLTTPPSKISTSTLKPFLSPTFTLTPTPTPTYTPISTFTSTPTLTPTPSPVPTAFGGGGAFVLTLNKRVFSQMFNLPGESNLFLAKPDGSKLTPLSSGEENIAFSLENVSPDGTSILYIGISGDPWKALIGEPKGDLYSMKLNEKTSIRLNEKGMTVYPHASRWLPDGRVVFVGVSSVGQAVYLVNSDGSGLTLLKNTIGATITGKAEILSISPDASEMYWVTGGRCNDRGLCGEIYFNTKLDGSIHKQVWPWLQAGSNTISLSPDGKFIAYSTFYGGDPISRPKNKCFVAKVDGSEIREIGSSDCQFLGTDHKAAWSPDGKNLIFWQSGQSGQTKLYSVGEKQIMDLPHADIPYCSDAIWFSDNHRVILYHCHNFVNKAEVELPALLFDLKAETVTQIAGSSSCAIVPSPNEQELWVFNCSNPQAASELYSIFNLHTQTSQPLFTGLHIINDLNGAYIRYCQPSRWIKAGNK